MSDKERYSGCRIGLTAHNENQYNIDVKMTIRNIIERTNSHKYTGSLIRSYPELEIVKSGKIYRKFVNNIIDSMVFCGIRFSRWEDGPTTPSGNYFFIDAGVSAKVKTLELFYRIENITGEDMQWFNALGWQGRNAMWGVKWEFEE